MLSHWPGDQKPMRANVPSPYLPSTPCSHQPVNEILSLAVRWTVGAIAQETFSSNPRNCSDKVDPFHGYTHQVQTAKHWRRISADDQQGSVSGYFFCYPTLTNPIICFRIPLFVPRWYSSQPHERDCSCTGTLTKHPAKISLTLSLYDTPQHCTARISIGNHASRAISPNPTNSKQ